MLFGRFGRFVASFGQVWSKKVSDVEHFFFSQLVMIMLTFMTMLHFFLTAIDKF